MKALSLVSLLISFSAAAANIEPPELEIPWGGVGNVPCRATCVGVAANSALLGEQPVIGYGTTELKAYNSALGVCLGKVNFGNDHRIVEKFLAQDVVGGYPIIDGRFTNKIYSILSFKRVSTPDDCR